MIPLPVVALALLATGPGAMPRQNAAGSPIVPLDTVPFFESFSRLEVGLALSAAVGGLLLLGPGNLVLDAPSARLGAPDRDSLDARISRQLHREGSGRLFWRVPDAMGFILPALPLAFYGLDSWYLLTEGAPALARADGNPHHRLMAYVEAVGVTYLLTGIVKYAVGRPRPYLAEGNDHPQLRGRRSEDNLSFFSAHASATFAAGAFLAEDLSRAVARQRVGTTPLGRALLGTVLPYGLGYGLPALVSISRVVDQQHWPSDVVAGALCGVLISRLTYALHFDGEGRPRRRRAIPGQGQLVPVMMAVPTPTSMPGPEGGFALLWLYMGKF